MNFDSVFSVAFLCQVVMISVWLPWIVRVRARALLDGHPEAEYPRLYPKSRAWYETALSRFATLNTLACVLGLGLWVCYSLDSTNADYAGVVWAVFMGQSIPFIYLEITAFRAWRLMRDADDRRQRKASLKPRRLSDVVNKRQVVSLIVLFAAFCGFIVYVDQFEYPWFGGWLNVLILTGTFAAMLCMVAWQLHSKNRDPYVDEEAHLQRVRHIATQVMLVCHALILYAMVTITLQAFELHELKQLAMTIYCQCLVLAYYLMILRKLNINFDVYRASTDIRAQFS